MRPNSAQAVAELVKRAQGGDKACFETLIRLFERTVVGHVSAVVDWDPEEAADIACDTWADAWVQLPSLRAPAKFLAWVLAIAHNKARDALARHIVERRRRQELVTEGEDGEKAELELAALSDPIGDAETEHFLRDFISSRPPLHGLILLWRLEGWEHEEIAAELGRLGVKKSAQAVRLIYHRMCKELRRQWAAATGGGNDAGRGRGAKRTETGGGPGGTTRWEETEGGQDDCLCVPMPLDTWRRSIWLTLRRAMSCLLARRSIWTDAMSAAGWCRS